MNTKFTKGPWLIAGDAFVYSLFYARGAERNKWSFQGAPDVECDREEMIANAALIASAPELYDALEQIAALYIDDRSSAMHKALCIANKALKKARGEA